MYTSGETANEQRTMSAMQDMAGKVPDLSSLTLRDLFAMCYAVNADHTCPGIGKYEYFSAVAESAYDFADEMLKARK